MSWVKSLDVRYRPSLLSRLHLVGQGLGLDGVQLAGQSRDHRGFRMVGRGLDLSPLGTVGAPRRQVALLGCTVDQVADV